MSSFAESDYGIAYTEMLQAYGKTPGEWGELPREERLFLEAAWREKREREASTTDDLDLEELR